MFVPMWVIIYLGIGLVITGVGLLNELSLGILVGMFLNIILWPIALFLSIGDFFHKIPKG